MRSTTLWARLLGLVKAVVEDVCFDEDEECIVVSVRPRKATKRRCGRCGKRCAGYDQGDGRRRWRALDLGTVRAFLEADSPRVSCPEHGVVAAQVPWARHGAGHTYAFDDTTAWLATHCSKSAVRDLLRVAWRTVGSIVSRVVADAENQTDRFANLRRIGIDEISYKRGHKYLTVVVDHDTGVLLWAHDGRDRNTLGKFFDRLGEDRCAKITLVSADAAEWISLVVHARCPNAELCLDPFHTVAWATKALDEVRREVWNAARKNGQNTVARDLKNARYALWKNPEDLTERQAAKLASIAQTNHRLYRAYLLNYPALGVGSSRGAGGPVVVDALEVAFEAGDHSVVAGGLAGPASVVGVVAEGVDVGELGLDCGLELGRGHEVRAGLADVGVGAGFGDEIAGAVAVGDAGLEHLGGEPLRRGPGRRACRLRRPGSGGRCVRPPGRMRT